MVMKIKFEGGKRGHILVDTGVKQFRIQMNNVGTNFSGQVDAAFGSGPSLTFEKNGKNVIVNAINQGDVEELKNIFWTMMQLKGKSIATKKPILVEKSGVSLHSTSGQPLNSRAEIPHFLKIIGIIQKVHSQLRQI